MQEEWWRLENEKVQPFWQACRITQKQTSLKKYYVKEKVETGE